MEFKDWIETQEHKKSDWIIVFRQQVNELNDFRTTSALASQGEGHLERILSSHIWEINRAGGFEDFGKPSFEMDGNDLVYSSGQSTEINGILFQPIIFCKYHPLNPEHFSVELIQTFLLFHDAFLVPEKHEYQRVNEDGDVEVVAKFSDEEGNIWVKVNVHLLRDYLAANSSYLVRYHDHRRKSLSDPRDFLGTEYEKKPVSGESYRFELCVSSMKDSHQTEFKRLSTLLGKDIVMPFTKPLEYHRYQFTCQPEKEYGEFIYKIDVQGRELKSTCDKEKLSNYFVDRGTPHYLTPVFFAKEVLRKYYASPSRYRVGKRGVSCLNKWSLEIDENQEGLVQAYLGDMGDIPYKEQLHWMSHNVSPKGGITRERYKCDFCCDPIEPQNDPVYYFKKEFELLQIESNEVLGEPLFRPLRDDDAHRYSSIRMPLNEEWTEINEQVQSLAVLIPDSINVKLLKHLIKQTAPTEDLKGKKPIQMLEAYLQSISATESDITAALGGLRLIQDLRSCGTAHRRGSNFGEVLRKYNLTDLSKENIMRQVFHELTRGLLTLRVLL